MMTTLGNKKNVKIFSFALAGVFIASVVAMAVVSMGDTANAAPTSDIGVVDQRKSFPAMVLWQWTISRNSNPQLMKCRRTLMRNLQA